MKKKNCRIRNAEYATLLNERELRILETAGLEKVYDFEDLPIVGLVQLNKLGFESTVDVLKVLEPYYSRPLPEKETNDCDSYETYEELLSNDDLYDSACIYDPDDYSYVEELLNSAGYYDETSIASMTVGQALSIPGMTFEDVRALSEYVMKTYYRLYKFQNILMTTYLDVMTNIPVLFGTRL